MTLWQLRLPVFSTGGVETGGTGSPPPGGTPPGTGDAPPKPGEGTGTKPPGTALDLPEEGKDKQIVAPADWPDDWKVKLAGEDKDALKRLDRFKSPGDLWKSYAEADKKIRSGKASADEPMPDPAKDADGAKAWRKERGIPDDPTGYELPKTVQERLTDEDKPVLASFTEFAHKKGLPPIAVASAAEWYVDMQEQTFAQREAADKQQVDDTQDALRAELGKEFRPFTTVAKRFAQEVTPGIDWFEARLPPEPGYPHGRKLSNVPEFVKALGEMGMQKFGDVAFAGGEASTKTMGRLEEIERIRDQEWSKYKDDEKLQAEYQTLLDAAIKSGKRKAR